MPLKKGETRRRRIEHHRRPKTLLSHRGGERDERMQILPRHALQLGNIRNWLLQRTREKIRVSQTRNGGGDRPFPRRRLDVVTAEIIGSIFGRIRSRRTYPQIYAYGRPSSLRSTVHAYAISAVCQWQNYVLTTLE